MPEHVWSVLCDRGIVDRFTNRVTLFNVVESGSVPADAAMGSLVGISGMLLSLWIREDPDTPETAMVRTGLRVPSGHTIIAKESLEIDLRESLWFRTLAHIKGIPFHGPGLYRIIVECQRQPDTSWKEVAQVPFQFLLEPRPEGPPALPPPSARPAKAPRRKRPSRKAKRK
jgi:hypothetical protein